MKKKIPIDYLHPHEDNIRKKFDKEKLKLLAKSIEEIGIIQPITILKDGTIIAGLRRHEAAKMAGYKELRVGKDVIFVSKSQKDMDTINAAENMVRENLDVWEESDSFLKMCERHLRAVKTKRS